MDEFGMYVILALWLPIAGFAIALCIADFSPKDKQENDHDDLFS